MLCLAELPIIIKIQLLVSKAECVNGNVVKTAKEPIICHMISQSFFFQDTQPDANVWIQYRNRPQVSQCLLAVIPKSSIRSIYRCTLLIRKIDTTAICSSPRSAVVSYITRTPLMHSKGTKTLDVRETKPKILILLCYGVPPFTLRAPAYCLFQNCPRPNRIPSILSKCRYKSSYASAQFQKRTHHVSLRFCSGNPNSTFDELMLF